MIPALLVVVLAVPGPDLGSALSSAVSCFASLIVLVGIPLAAYAALQLRGRLHRAGKERGDQSNLRQLGKTPVNGGAANGGGNP